MTDGPFGAGRERAGVEPEPEPEPRPPSRRPPARRRPSQTGWIAGVAIVALLAYITFNTLHSDPVGSRGVADGQPLPPFAVPLVTGTVQGDANVAVKARNGVPKACDVHLPQTINSCDLARDKPLVLAFLASRSAKCIDEIDALDALRPRHPDVRFAAVAIRGSRHDLRGLVRSHHWGLPVGYDRDGAVSNAYGIAVCPTIAFASRGGRVQHTLLGEATSAQLQRAIEALE